MGLDRTTLKVILFTIFVIAFGLSKNVSAESKIYWTDATEGKIQQAQIGGSGQINLISGLGNAGGIAVSPLTDKLYWTNSLNHKIQFADTDGNNVKDLIIDGISNPLDLAIYNGKIYWTDATLKLIKRANLDGTNAENVITSLNFPKAIAIDSNTGKIYWSDSWYPASIKRANLDGSSIETIISDNLGDPSGLAVDSKSGKLYWTDASGATAKIERANLDGSARQQLITSGLYWPRGIFLDVEGDRMYWTDSWQPGSINFAQLDGSNPKILISNLGNIVDIAMDIQQPVSLEISGETTAYEDFTTNYTAKAVFSDATLADVTKIVNWSVEGNACASIVNGGNLKIDQVTVSDSFIIKARYTAGGATVEAQFPVNIAVPVSLSISGAQIVKEAVKWQYTAFANYDNGQQREVTNKTNWSVNPDTYAQIDSSGLLTVNHIETGQNINISAHYARSVSPKDTQITVNLIALQTLTVPGQYGTIQSAIDAATDYDTVLIADGIYTGQGNRSIYFYGKPLMLKAQNGPVNCIIDCKNVNRAFNFVNEEGPYSILDGFTIKNSKFSSIYCSHSSPIIKNCLFADNYDSDTVGAAISAQFSNPIIDKCKFINNYAAVGGAIYSWEGNINIRNCVFSNNTSKYTYQNNTEGAGGAIYISQGTTPNIADCLFYSNSSFDVGGAIYSRNCQTLKIKNCTFVNNSATYGGAFYDYMESAEITNCIFWANKGSYGKQLGTNGGIVNISYSDVSGLLADTVKYSDGTITLGRTNISKDPCFVNPVNDFHLLNSSPCINAGDPKYVPETAEMDLDGQNRIMNGRIDMGAYETFINEPPVACISGANQVIEAQGPFGAKITLDGSCSTDNDSTNGTNDDIEKYNWYEIDPCDITKQILLGTGEQFDCNLPLGIHQIILEVIDKADAANTAQATIEVKDTIPPELNFSVNPVRLWPPNHKMIKIIPQWNVTDICDRSPQVSIIEIRTNEIDEIINGPDYQIINGEIYLKAERNENGTGRIYTITCQAKDFSGNITLKNAAVLVPHDLSK